MTRFLSETPEERRKERDEAFCIRVVELSILATTLCGVMISFSYEANIIALFLFVLSSSFFIAGGMGLIFLVLLGRGYFAEKLPTSIMEKLRGLSVLIFFFGMVAFFIGIASLVVFNTVFYIIVAIPYAVMWVPFMYYLRKYKAS